MSNITPLRSGMTAIAAVLAMSATPLLAQATDGAAQAAPVLAPPAPEIAPAPPAAEVAPAVPVAVEAAPAMRTMSTPVIHTEDTAEASAPRAAAPVERRVTRQTTSASTRTAAPAATTVVAPAAAPAAPAAPKMTRSAPSVANPAPAPVAKTTSVSSTDQAEDGTDIAPIAGAAGLGLLAIGGLLFAFRRKREDQDGYQDEYVPETIVAAPTPLVAPSARRSRASAKVAGPVTALPKGFDLSRYGPHVQAAYRGPTEDNPFLSLKRRLHQARFYDQREREAAARAATAVKPKTAAAATRATAAPTKQRDEQVTIQMAPQRRKATKKLGFA